MHCHGNSGDQARNHAPELPANRKNQVTHSHARIVATAGARAPHLAPRADAGRQAIAGVRSPIIRESTLQEIAGSPPGNPPPVFASAVLRI
jgi:hypothetical protein